jgi:hypothetical protein
MDKPKLRKDRDNDYGDLIGSTAQKQWAYEIRELGKFSITRHTPTNELPEVNDAINQVLKDKNQASWYIDNRLTFNYWLFDEVNKIFLKEQENNEF